MAYILWGKASPDPTKGYQVLLVLFRQCTVKRDKACYADGRAIWQTPGYTGRLAAKSAQCGCVLPRQLLPQPLRWLEKGLTSKPRQRQGREMHCREGASRLPPRQSNRGGSEEPWGLGPTLQEPTERGGRCRGRHRSSLSPRVRMRLHFGSSFFPWNRSYWNIPCVSSIHFLSFHTLVDFFKAPAGSYQSVKWNAPFNLADGKLCILTSMPQTALWRANSGSAHEPVPSSQLNKGRECQGEVFAEKS